MTDLTAHLEEYLRLRRSLGFQLERPGHELPKLIKHIEAAGGETITTDLAIAWAKLPQGVQPLNWAHRLSAARGFATYLQTIDPATEVPPRDVFGARQQRPTPYLWSEADICRLLEGARLLEPELRAMSCEAALGLLAATGMRIREAIDLERGDVDLATGMVTIRDGKFRRARLVPVHKSTAAALRRYAERRDRLCPRPRPTAFFVSAAGKPLTTGSVRTAFIRITTELGLRTAEVRPRVHDLRHSFTIRTLINWLRAGADIDVLMPALATYLGHVNPVGTYWYLEASPELMELAAARLDGRFGERP
jgi:integrase/recombinase XerD